MSPGIAAWINENWPEHEASSFRALGLRDAEDSIVFEAARKAGAVVVTKDSDFINLLEGKGSPPKVLLLSFGNASNRHTKEILSKSLPEALDLLKQENLVEIA